MRIRETEQPANSHTVTDRVKKNMKPALSGSKATELVLL